MISASASPCARIADARPSASTISALLLGFGQRFNALAFDFGLLQHRGDQFVFAAQDFRFLHLDLAVLSPPVDLHFLGDNLLLHDVGLDLVGLVGLRLLLLHEFPGTAAFLISRSRCASACLACESVSASTRSWSACALATADSRDRFGAFDRGVAFGFRRGHVGIALDARDVRAAHVGDVFVLVADFLDGEGNHFQAHLVHVVGAGGAHAIAHHLRLLHDLFHRQLADDAAQMAFHHQADQAFALLRRLGQKLLRGGQDRFRIGLHFDLRHRFHRDRHALPRVQILLAARRRKTSAPAKAARVFHHREDHRTAALDDARAAKPINDDGLVRPRLAEQLGEHHHQKHDAGPASPVITMISIIFESPNISPPKKPRDLMAIFMNARTAIASKSCTMRCGSLCPKKTSPVLVLTRTPRLSDT